MTALEVVAGVLVGALFVVGTAALWVGLLGAIGAVRFVRCDRCRRFGLTSLSAPLRECVRCRHGRLLHPMVTLHDAHLFHHHGPSTQHDS
ncbi:MAG: hypothetical protein ACRDY0_04285 [Acidimicrobiales bacterium]